MEKQTKVTAKVEVKEVISKLNNLSIKPTISTSALSAGRYAVCDTLPHEVKKHFWTDKSMPDLSVY
jgi:hypothetical protein